MADDLELVRGLDALGDVNCRSSLMMSGARLTMWPRLAKPAPMSSMASRTPSARIGSSTEHLVKLERGDRVRADIDRQESLGGDLVEQRQRLAHGGELELHSETDSVGLGEPHVGRLPRWPGEARERLPPLSAMSSPAVREMSETAPMAALMKSARRARTMTS